MGLKILKKINVWNRWRVAQPKPSVHGKKFFFIFMLTQPRSGSTAIAKCAASLQQIGLLHGEGEGQWLVKDMGSGNRWNPKKSIDKGSLKNTWIDVALKMKSRSPKMEIMFEKSPPNMVRFDLLIEVFPNNASFVSNRSPYACVASALFHRYPKPLVRIMPFWFKRRVLRQLVSDWIFRSNILMMIALKHNLIVITYEDICACPSVLVAWLKSNTPVCSEDISNASSAFGALSNKNPEQISDLLDSDLEVIRHELTAVQELLKFFGYTLSYDPEELVFST